MKDEDSGQCRGFAFVDFESEVHRLVYMVLTAR